MKKVLAVFDKKTALYDPAGMCRTYGEATRDWDIIRKNPETKIAKFPADFDLYHIADYDEETGKYTNLNPPTQLASGVE